MTPDSYSVKLNCLPISGDGLVCLLKIVSGKPD